MDKEKLKKKIKLPLFILCGILAGFLLGFLSEILEFKDLMVPVFLLVIAAVCMIMAVKLSFKNRKKMQAQKERELKRKAERENLDTERLDKIIEYLKEHYQKSVYRIETLEGECALDDSKFGGYPCWPKDEPYPQSKRGEKLVFLAQINYTKEAFDEYPLPKEGLLQIFVLDDDYVGCNFFGEDYEIGNYKVVYHKSVDHPLSIEDMQEQGIPATTALDQKLSCFPFFSERRMIFKKETDYIASCVSGFDEAVAKAVKDLYGEEMTGSTFGYFNYTEDEYLCEPFDTFGHKILGYPAFTQSDPRSYAEEIRDGMGKFNTKYYDTVLLQVDSQDDQMWGDCGVANFFINSDALSKLDFSDVYYTWDCC